MKFDVRLGSLQDDERTNHPTIMISATIEAGDAVTVGSQHSQEFSVPALGAFLSERRSPRPENEQVAQGNPDLDIKEMDSAQAEALDQRDKEAEDTSRNEAANTGDELAVGEVEEKAAEEPKKTTSRKKK